MSHLTHAYEAAEPDVVVDVVDDEVILINLDTGTYFRARGATATAWEVAVSGRVLAESAAIGHDGFADFVGTLVDHGLVRPLPAAVAAPGADALPTGELALEVYSDLQDLLSLDPVHEVDSSAGWPASS